VSPYGVRMPDFPPCDDTCGALSEHVRRNFPGKVIEAFTWEAGPIRQQNPHFRALRIEPGESGVWTYASVGAWAATENQDHGLEFTIAMPVQDPRAVELASLLYPWGPELQTCHVGDRHVDFLWLLPITRQERDFKVANGLEALEALFEERELRYWDPQRPSAV
jgi:Suppressor of fused protein (SUFU)